jgi:CRISPR-associated endonuclease Csn1
MYSTPSRKISVAQLFSGEVDVDHILPYSRSLDDSMANKVVCFRDENRLKGNQTPHEWLAARHRDKYEQVLSRADKLLSPGKANKFRLEHVTLDDFFARQFVDTAYITTQVREYLERLGVDVVCTKGQHTSDLRWHWGLETLLRDLQDSPAWTSALKLPDGQKNRLDHRHHAIDAIVIALTNRSRLQQLAALRRRGGTETTGEILSEPWDRFRHDVDNAIRSIHVSHRPRRRVRGALHEDTLYGPTERPGVFVYRKPLESLTLAMIPKITDPAIRRLVESRVAQFKSAIQGDKIPKEAWARPLTMPSGVPVRKVRIERNEQTILPIRNGAAHVKPGSIHHIAIFELPDRSRQLVPVSTIEARRRIRAKLPLINRKHPTHPNAKFLFSLSGSEMLLIHHKGKELLCRFDTASSTSGQMWFRHHTVAGKSSDKIGVISKMPGTLHARKVTVDVLGRIRRAKD